MNWKVTAFWKEDYKGEVIEERKKIWRNISAISAEEAIWLTRTLADFHCERWPLETKWTVEEEK